METIGKLILKYHGEKYSVLEKQFAIKLITFGEFEPYFQFDFQYPGSNTVESVVFSFSNSNVGSIIMRPFGLEFIKCTENQFFLLFQMVEELADDAEIFSGVTKFNTSIPEKFGKRLMYDFNK